MSRTEKTRRNGLGLPLAAIHQEALGDTSVSVSTAVRHFIESRDRAAELQRDMMQRLARSSVSRPISRGLRRCRVGRRCHSPQCKFCGRLFRLWLAPQAIAFYQTLPQPLIVTINLKDIPVGDLAKVNLSTEKDALRKVLTRFGIRACIGGFEVAFKPVRQEWTLHAHLLVFGHSKMQLEGLREHFKLDRAIEVKRVRKPVRQITYLLKFGTYYRYPGSKRVWPLPDECQAELAEWRSALSFVDFVMLIGFQRRGTIVPNKHVRAMKTRALGDVETLET